MNHNNAASSIKRRWVWRYGLAFVAVAAGFGLRQAFETWVGPGLPTYVTFYPAVMVAALLAGFGPGLLATALTGLLTAYWILPPAGQFTIATPVDRVGLALFTGMGLFMSAVAELYRRDRRKAAAYDQEMALSETRREKDFLADVLEHTSQPFAVGYPDGRMGLCNRAYEQLTGYHAEELRAIDWATMLTPPEWRELERQKLEELHRTGQPVRYEKEYIRKDGTRLPIELLVHLVKDAAGQPEYYYSFLTDITERKLAEEVLTSQRKQLQVILESVPAMIFYKDKENHFVRTNKAFENAMGRPKEKLQGQSLFDLYPKEMAEAYWNDDKDVMASRKSKSGIVEPMQTPNGTRIVQTDKVPYFDESGNVIGVIGFAIDITEHTRAEEALKKAHAELEVRVEERTADLRAASSYARSLLEASLDPLVTISQDGKITDVNQATELVTGVPREQLIGTDFARYFTEPQKAEAGYQMVLAEGQVRDYPLTIRHTSGRTTEVLYHATVYRNEAGAVQGVFAAARDVTGLMEDERRRGFTNALLALFAQKAAFKEYLDSVMEVIRDWTGSQCLGVRVADAEGNIPFAAHVGFDAEFLRLENQLSLLTDCCLCIRAISQKTEASDAPLRTAGGSFRLDDSPAFVRQLSPEQQKDYRGTCMKFAFASLAIIPIRYHDRVLGAIHLADRRPGQFPPDTVEFLESMAPLIGEALHRFSTEAELAHHRDHLEELVKLRTAELARSNEDLEQFAYVASHDLQEPLRAVGGYVELLRHRFPEKLDDKALQYIAGAVAGAARMQTLIADLLAFSRVGTQGKVFVPADLNALLAQTLDNLQASVQEVHATVTSDPLPCLPVDATQIVQLFQNLIGNALKFRSERPLKIHVGAQPQEGRWLFSVRDNGIGIEPQYFQRIFQLFQRLHTRRHYPGTGIGLAICKKIVERHGGEIRVESQPDQGATFFFSIPQISGMENMLHEDKRRPAH